MKILIFYVAIFFVLLFTFFIEKNGKKNYTPIPIGTLYNQKNSNNSLLKNMNITEKALFVREQKNIDLPIITIFSDLEMPDKFLGIKTEKENAKYIISKHPLPSFVQNNKPKLNQFEAKPKKEPIPSITDKNIPTVDIISTPPPIIEKDEKNISFNTNIINNIIKNSDKTYFFSRKEEELNDVTVRIYSSTPWEKKYIFKFLVTNSQTQYFFIANVSLYIVMEKTKKLILSDLYYDPFVSPEKSTECLAVINQTEEKDYIVNITESGGRKRVFTLKFSLP